MEQRMETSHSPQIQANRSHDGHDGPRSSSALQSIRRPIAQVLSNEPQLARALGWFSIGLGLTELLMPRRLGRAIGVGQRSNLLPMLGLREIASGIGILAMPDPTHAVRSRVVGDVIDLAFLGGALRSRRSNPTRIAAATAAVVGVTALDVLCSVRLSRSSAAATERPIRVSKSLAINRPAEELYRFWRQLDNLPRVMSHLQSVQPRGGQRSHWVAKGPAGASIEWDAEITADVPNQRLAWRSLEGSDLPNEGSVTFKPLPAERGTVVSVELRYSPPGGRLGSAIAKLFGEVPEQQIGSDLRRFKQLMETGEVATTEGQPSGRRSIVSRQLP
jgi:uncharacterized membrane protein